MSIDQGVIWSLYNSSNVVWGRNMWAYSRDRKEPWYHHSNYYNPNCFTADEEESAYAGLRTDSLGFEVGGYK